MSATKIEWSDSTWNPVTGCSKVSEGCRHCYAEQLFPRAYGKQRVFTNPTGQIVSEHALDRTGQRHRRFTDVQTHVERLASPLRWRKPRRVFVNSMSDLFHEDVSDAFIAAVFGVMAAAPAHTFQVLTKRPERMLRWFDWIGRKTPTTVANSEVRTCALAAANVLREKYTTPGVEDVVLGRLPWPLPNVWLGVSAENQETYDKRAALLCDVPAAVRFVSLEPLLAPIDLVLQTVGGMAVAKTWLDWVIVGGESGQRARRCDVAWIRSIVDQCREAEVPVFVKQLGTRSDWQPPVGGLRHPKGGMMDEWPHDVRIREYPNAGVARSLIQRIHQGKAWRP